MDKATLKLIIQKQERLAQQRGARRVVDRTLDLASEISSPEISIITGVRRCGKSVYLHQLKEQCAAQRATLLIEFDDPALEGFSGSDFSHISELFDELHPGRRSRMLLLDEVQNIEKWEKWLPQLAKDRDLKIVATGSNATLLSSELGTYLTGRHRAHEMMPLSFEEIVRFNYPEITAADLTEAQRSAAYARYVTYGGFPRTFVENDATILPQYFSDIVERDVIARHGARLTRPLRELARVLCSDNTKLLNRTRLAKQLGVKDDATIKRYCRWLEECYLFHEVKRFSPSVRKQMRSNPKYYCIDGTLARSSAFSILQGDGAFLENAVYLELRRRGYEIHYWVSESGKAEVDFIVRKGGHSPQGVQVSLTVEDEGTLERELRGLSYLGDELGIADLHLITALGPAQELHFEGKQITCKPFVDWALFHGERV